MCQAEGVPPPRISWLKNGEVVHLNGRIKMYSRYCAAGAALSCRSRSNRCIFDFHHFFTCFCSKLVITQIIPEDDAIYQCLAESGEGSVLSLARLIVVMSEDRPSAPRNIHAETISSSAILLAWEKPLYNADKVIAYSIHYMKAEGKHWKEEALTPVEDEGWGRSTMSLTMSPLSRYPVPASQGRPSGVAARSKGQGGLRKATSLE